MEFLKFNVTKLGLMLAPARSATSSVLLWDVKGIYKSGGEACLLPQHDKVWHVACVWRCQGTSIKWTGRTYVFLKLFRVLYGYNWTWLSKSNIPLNKIIILIIVIVINLVLHFSRVLPLPLDGGNSGPDEICHFHLHIIKVKNYSNSYIKNNNKPLFICVCFFFTGTTSALCFCIIKKYV